MSKELAEPHHLNCGCCGKEFTATKYQVSNAKYSGTTPYCSKECRTKHSKINRANKKTFTCGPCPVCSKLFQSKVRKKYCSQECYHKSDECLERLRKLNEDRKNDVEGTCPQCGTKFVAKASRKKKFCCKPCYRQYMAERFDRWVASPENINTPQNFDEFLTKEKLPCLVSGCNWEGKNLGQHLNFHHGITAREFKMEAGFNLTTGLVTPEVSQALSSREHLKYMKFSTPPNRGGVGGYRSKEAIEHQKKARLLATVGPKRTCAQCKKTFQQSTKYGRALYCSIDCQNAAGTERFTKKNIPLICSHCGEGFKGNRGQQLRSLRGQVIACSTKCRGHLAMRNRTKKH